MGYHEALNAAGAEVLEFKEFGSYQGDWWAFVSYQGTKGWVHGYFGSCDYCDSFQAEFGYNCDKCEKHKWDCEPNNCKACKKAQKEYANKLERFGKNYLDNILTTKEAVKKAYANIAWDGDVKAMVDFIKKTSKKFS